MRRNTRDAIIDGGKMPARNLYRCDWLVGFDGNANSILQSVR